MNGNLPSTKALAIAQQLFAQEAGTRGPSGASMPVAVEISEKLRRPLTTLTGSSGFRALLSRALTLAKVQDPALGSVQLRPDGALFGFGDLSGAHSLTPMRWKNGPAGSGEVRTWFSCSVPFNSIRAIRSPKRTRSVKFPASGLPRLLGTAQAIKPARVIQPLRINNIGGCSSMNTHCLF